MEVGVRMEGGWEGGCMSDGGMSDGGMSDGPLPTATLPPPARNIAMCGVRLCKRVEGWRE